jgi:heme a synthase
MDMGAPIYISALMTRRFARLAWSAAAATYLLIILGAIVRITGSGMGCGEHWPLCNGRLLPPLDVPTMIEYGHRLAAAAVTGLVAALAAYTWWLRRGAGSGERFTPDRTAYVAAGLLTVQVLLGAITVKLSLPSWTVILHLGTAMLLLAALLVAAREPRTAKSSPAERIALALGLVTVLFGALTANLGAATACLGFPLCNEQLLPAGNYLQHVHWTHRLLAYTLFGYVVWWAVHTKRRGAWWVVALVILQVIVAATMVLTGLPRLLQAAHVAIGAAVWAGLVSVISYQSSVISHQSSELMTDD